MLQVLYNNYLRGYEGKPPTKYPKGCLADKAYKDGKSDRKNGLPNRYLFPKFWYESNACWGWVNSIEDLREKMKHQTNLEDCGIFKTKDEFLDKSFQNEDGSLDFGTRIEHFGTKTLREFLLENHVDINKL